MKLKLYILFFLITSSLFAQKVTTSVDKTTNKIGAEFKLTLRTEVDTLTKVVFPKGNHFGALEVLESYKVDTIKKNDRYELIKKYGLTQFDSGRYMLPSLPIIIKNKTVFSDSIALDVNNVKVDTLKQKMYDIKDIEKVESSNSWWYYIVIGILLLIVVGYLVYRYIKNYKKPQKAEELIYKTPIEKATGLLQQLESKSLWQKGNVKEYYSELTDIARNYIEEEIHIPAMESTTSELVIGLRKVAKQKKLKLSTEILENLEKVLKQADLVKFAKVTPLDYEIEEDKKRIANSIITLHKSIPVVEEETDELAAWNQEQQEKARLEKLKKQKRKRIIYAISAFIFVFFATIVFVITTKGFDYLKDNFIGHPTKELAEGEWIYSEYGNPGIRIETPKVLKRMDAEKILPKGATALIKEMQIFSYGSILDNFYLVVSTNKYKQAVKLDLEKAADASLQYYEKQGATNMIVKTEDYDTQNGITGKKAYGSFTVLDPLKSKSVKMFYEMLLFSQEGGLQQIVIMYPEEDKYGEQIAERLINSVELKKTEE
ncbi:FeoB-associated Cys-rich membrane protein [Flavobacterium sp. SUN046]|uniref:FeoB-associated Cys-rich membrane protein n=1 Tax=Flavobacterium sp. SUN046 TaxID=3002440 RepID=UPI002DBE1AA6|nr:FeoB-associated Cys-rich membrane protein [Flavobacterium sp. SUN046]MEC4050143.1 FeoB-associated Cys-rich membrane protein [Flavobacterium sp. SUN046]